MRLTSMDFAVLTAALVGLSACHTGRAGEDTGTLPAPEVNANAAAPVIVENHNTSQMDIFAVRSSGQRIRVGEANSLATSTLKLPRSYLDPDGSVQLIAAPVGAPGAVSSGTLIVQPGQVVKWTIEASLPQSSATVE